MRLAFILSIILIILFVYFCIIVPYPLKYYVLSNTHVDLTCTPNDNVMHFDSQKNRFGGNVTNTDGTMYLSKNSPSVPGLIVWFNGGAFLSTDRRSSFGILNELNKRMPYYDIVTFDYPTRFRHTLRDSLERVYSVLRVLFERKDYQIMYAIGLSAGVLLAGAYQNNETNSKANEGIGIMKNGKPFNGIISLCGLLMPSFNDPYIDYAFKFYVMRGTSGSKYYTCLDIIDTPKLLISSTVDYLRTQTLRFIETEPCLNHVYKSRTLPHSFPLMPHLNETQDLIDRVLKFINDGKHRV